MTKKEYLTNMFTELGWRVIDYTGGNPTYIEIRKGYGDRTKRFNIHAYTDKLQNDRRSIRFKTASRAGSDDKFVNRAVDRINNIIATDMVHAYCRQYVYDYCIYRRRHGRPDAYYTQILSEGDFPWNL